MTRLLLAWKDGDQSALEPLIDLVHDELRRMAFFGGLSVEETADVLKVFPDTVIRDWRLAKAWLLRELKSGLPS